MKVIYAPGEIKKNPTVAAIGIFDGVHRGHRYLLKAMQRRAAELKCRSMVITFFPHPAHVMRPDIKLGYLVSLAHRLQLLEDMGVDMCLVINFNKKFASIEPGVFIRETLVKKFGVRAVFVGQDFRFGRDRSGDVGFFKRLAPIYGFEMHAMPALIDGKGPVSSTRIRALVGAGKLAAARKLLGRPFSVLGTVVRGEGRGKTLGFPTANVYYESQVLPPNGVYAVRVVWKGKVLKGAANLGLRPSLQDKNPQVHLEVYILDFKKNIYGQMLEVEFIKKLRNEKKFASLDMLTRQIQKDVCHVRAVL